MRLLFLSTSVGPLGTGLGGGVELTLYNVALEMLRRQHQLTILAPMNSQMGNLPIVEVAGELQVPAQTQDRDVPVIMAGNSVLVNMCEYARKVQSEYDLIVNFAYDWLPCFLTRFYNIPIAHVISMGSLSQAMDTIVGEIVQEFPGTIGVCTKVQAETFTFAKDCKVLGSGIDLSLYNYCETPENQLAWVARIAPEKGLEDAVAAAQILGIPLKIFGKIQDQEYWEKILRDYPDAPIEYVGFLSTTALQAQLGKCRGMLMTPRWVEAFGNVAIEALACGVPVIAYRRGGPIEIVRDGETGFLVEPDSVDALVDAINNLDKINRYYCRKQAEEEYSLPAWGDRMEQWFKNILTADKRR
ncbi:glycosyltransferase family 4 protein [Ancylothrix sp. C2]|uniref:glycosyltransferase family 4 protein n=1 Tax=Ancylothrix sp. D3o TaxID=2953691 RepID=UPI0021BBAF68|nr:glycosyltransferase family 4 protein [Ancylothrix sp. D3o]MCT7948494.1 glycosyltransferase family 4 protein [Ancylothrix sp. D3o]